MKQPWLRGLPASGQDTQWQVVRYDETTQPAVLDRPFRLADAAGFE